MPATLAFDVYGTLIDTKGVLTKLQDMIGDKAAEFSRQWRDKQLEYSFRRGLMGRYEPFSICTSQSLDYTDALLETGLSDAQKFDLMAEYSRLPAFDDVAQSLVELKSLGHQLFAFSNGTADAVTTLLTNAKLRELFDGVISVDDKQTFKPNPIVYQYVLDTTAAKPHDAWLISSNPFDVIGAVSHGLNSAWVRRSEKVVFDPWGVEPTVTITSLLALKNNL